jgi:hypothetical protein
MRASRGFAVLGSLAGQGAVIEKVMAWVRRYWHMVLLIAVVWISWALMVDLNTLGGLSFAEWFLERQGLVHGRPPENIGDEPE